MEFYDVLFGGILHRDIDGFIKNTLGISRENVINSHFYTAEAGDFAYSDEIDLKEYFSKINTANFFAKNVFMGRGFENVVCVISSDENTVDVECNVSEEDFSDDDIFIIEKFSEKLLDENIISFAEISSSCDDSAMIRISHGN